MLIWMILLLFYLFLNDLLSIQPVLSLELLTDILSFLIWLINNAQISKWWFHLPLQYLADFNLSYLQQLDIMNAKNSNIGIWKCHSSLISMIPCWYPVPGFNVISQVQIVIIHHFQSRSHTCPLLPQSFNKPVSNEI